MKFYKNASKEIEINNKTFKRHGHKALSRKHRIKIYWAHFMKSLKAATRNVKVRLMTITWFFHCVYVFYRYDLGKAYKFRELWRDYRVSKEILAYASGAWGSLSWFPRKSDYFEVRVLSGAKLSAEEAERDLSTGIMKALVETAEEMTLESFFYDAEKVAQNSLKSRASNIKRLLRKELRK